ncbi:TetR/AcrR family transcriptional regulator [Acidimicrobiia bacterium EGI L10123]|uniref:TetR/AcrR family transcriptional regulator n=1 Tax=Salinilacustrithrix flava TaxID=2957203 RepID=UPI003D7C2D7D|nr:TetR/AcrR family transcriptional regulator [Acidimicrobiia bacterium EGI L10123]
MQHATPSPAERPLRADARRNRRRLLDAAIALILELGGEPSRDAVAERAGVGIGTLYRHFPDRHSLLRAVALDVIDRTVERGEAALAESTSGGEALRRYLHDAVDSGLGVVNVVHALLDRTDWPDRRAAAQHVLDRLIDRARRDGAIDHDVTATDIALAAIRFCRPLAIGLDPAEERAIAHRQLAAYLDGLPVRLG